MAGIPAILQLPAEYFTGEVNVKLGTLMILEHSCVSERIKRSVFYFEEVIKKLVIILLRELQSTPAAICIIPINIMNNN